MPCEINKALKIEYDSKFQNRLFWHPANRQLQGTTEGKRKRYQKEADDAFNDIAEKLDNHKKYCEVCKAGRPPEFKL